MSHFSSYHTQLPAFSDQKIKQTHHHQLAALRTEKINQGKWSITVAVNIISKHAYNPNALINRGIKLVKKPKKPLEYVVYFLLGFVAFQIGIAGGSNTGSEDNNGETVGENSEDTDGESNAGNNVGNSGGNGGESNVGNYGENINGGNSSQSTSDFINPNGTSVSTEDLHPYDSSSPQGGETALVKPENSQEVREKSSQGGKTRRRRKAELKSELTDNLQLRKNFGAAQAASNRVHRVAPNRLNVPNHGYFKISEDAFTIEIPPELRQEVLSSPEEALRKRGWQII